MDPGWRPGISTIQEREDETAAKIMRTNIANENRERVKFRGFLLLSTYQGCSAASLNTSSLRSLGRIQYFISPHYSHLRILLDALMLTRRRTLTLLRPIGNTLIVAARIDAENATDVVAVTRHREFAESISPLVEESANGLADLILTVLGVMARAGDGIDGSGCRVMF